MSITIYPSLWTNGKAKEISEYYASIFPEVNILSENPVVTHIEINHFRIMLLNAVSQFHINPSISFFYHCKDQIEAEMLWKSLSENGKVLMEFDSYPWADKYGWIQDPFGVNWQIFYKNENPNTGKIIPSLMFNGINNGKLAGAISFYQDIFKTDSSQNIIAKYAENEPDTTGNIKYAEFHLDEYVVAAMENSGSHDFQFNEGVSFVVECETQAEIDHFWYKLSEGGTLGQCGWLKDQYGISWQIVPKILGEIMQDENLALTAMDVIMHTIKFEISKFEALRKLKSV